MSSAQQGPATEPAGAPGDFGQQAQRTVTAEVQSLLGALTALPVEDHAAVFADIHSVLQNALSDAGPESGARPEPGSR